MQSFELPSTIPLSMASYAAQNLSVPTNTQNTGHISGGSGGASGRISHPEAPGGTTTVAAPDEGGGVILRTYPNAMPSKLQERYPGPVLGTAIVSNSDPNAEDQDLFEVLELVTPEQSPLMTPFLRNSAAHIDGDEGNVGLSYFHSHSSLSVEPRELSSLSTSRGKGQSKNARKLERRNLRKLHEKQKKRNVIKEGGFLVFSDEYIRAHPESRAATVTEAYQKAIGGANSGDDITGDEKAQLHLLVKDLNDERRPIFRRKPAESVYGSSFYLTNDEADSLVPNKSARSESCVSATSIEESQPLNPLVARVSTL